MLKPTSLKKEFAACILLSVLCFCNPASADNGVLQSGGNTDTSGNTVSASSELVPADAAAAPAAASSSSSSGPQIKVTLHAKPAEPEVALKAAGPTNETPSADMGIFQASNPHAVSAPPGTSPFVQQVGTTAPGYSRQPVISYGARSTSSTATIQQKSS